MRGVFRLGGIFAIGLPLVFMMPAVAQPPATPNPSGPGGTSPSLPAPSETTPTLPTPGAPATTEGPQPSLGPTSPEGSEEQQATAEQQRLETLRRNRQDRLERRGPTEGYVTYWSGPHIIERTHNGMFFLVEGSWVRAKVPCWGWQPSDRVSFGPGPDGECTIYNRTRHRACPVACWAFPGWHKWY